ncbi:MAG: hypothetical protein GX496_06915, partial [Firmicutes bacterium]|nr:hypothetical protein [Bacillota bacterium]
FSQVRTADGTLQEYHAILQRMRELCVQASNDTLTDQDRAALQDEIDQLIREARAIATSTEFNRHTLLDGSFQGRKLHIGANANASIVVNIASARPEDVGAAWGDGKAIDTSLLSLTSGGLVINGVSIDLSGATTGGEVGARINAQRAQTGVIAARAGRTVVSLGSYVGHYAPATFTLNGVQVQIDQAVTTAQQFVDRLNQVRGQTGVTASVTADGEVVLVDPTGRRVAVQQSAPLVGAFSDTAVHTFERGLRLITRPGIPYLTLNGPDREELGLPEVGTGTAASGSLGIGAETGSLTVAATQPGHELNNLRLVFGGDSNTAPATSWDGRIRTLTVTADWDGTVRGTLQVASGHWLTVFADRPGPQLEGLRIRFGPSHAQPLVVGWDGHQLTVTADWDSPGYVQARGTLSVGSGGGELMATATQAGYELNGLVIEFGPDSDGPVMAVYDKSSRTVTVTADWDNPIAPPSLGELEDAINQALQSGGVTSGVHLDVTGDLDVADLAGAGSLTLSGGRLPAPTLGQIESLLNAALASAGYESRVRLSASHYVPSQLANAGTITLAGDVPTLGELAQAINLALDAAGFTTDLMLIITGSYTPSEFANQSPLVLTGGSGSGAEASDAQPFLLEDHTVATVDVRTAEDAQTSLVLLDFAIQQISEQRGTLGALENRLEHAIANLSVAVENLTAAESRIRDADMAREMMEWVRQQILLQSGMAMLAQANAAPQAVLQLLE